MTLKTVDEILAQNRRIIEINTMIIQTVLNPVQEKSYDISSSINKCPKCGYRVIEKFPPPEGSDTPIVGRCTRCSNAFIEERFE